jgi:hypothetical protein
MKKKFEKLDETFDIETVEKVEPEIIYSDPNDSDSSSIPPLKKNIAKIDPDDLVKDYEYTRANLYSIIEKGQEAINGILELAQETEVPRAYEVAGQLIKSVSDAADKLMDLQGKLKKIEENSPQRNTTNVTNALFVGSTSELSKLLRSQKLNDDK